MADKETDPVVFPSGTHEYSNGVGAATLHVPHDVSASDIAPAIAALIGGVDDAAKRATEAA